MMRIIVVLGAFLVAACAGQQAVVAPAAQPLGYAAAAPEPAVIEPEPSGFQALLDAHGVPLDTPRVGKAIIVNIPSFEAIALQDGEVAMRSRVIVGKPSRRTPRMDTATTVVRFRPWWRPTPSMVETGAYEDKLVSPGPRNPLGYAAIRLAEGDLIYLHGTNRPDLFERDMRALSWGCVRVERLDDMLAWLLDAEAAEIEGWTGGRRTFDAETDGVPVIVTYQTRFPDADGVMRDWPDVYGLGGAALVASN